jgi:hypothetical protein
MYELLDRSSFQACHGLTKNAKVIFALILIHLQLATCYSCKAAFRSRLQISPHVKN